MGKGTPPQGLGEGGLGRARVAGGKTVAEQPEGEPVGGFRIEEMEGGHAQTGQAGTGGGRVEINRLRKWRTYRRMVADGGMQAGAAGRGAAKGRACSGRSDILHCARARAGEETGRR
jgi:hypothetical protein